MPLLIEDGTGIPGANSYCTVDELRTYATDRGVAFPALPAVTDPITPDPAVPIFTPYLITACDYLETLRGQYNGWESTTTQTLAWPRAGVIINRGDWENVYVGRIPTQLKAAQMQLCVEMMNGVILSPTQAGSGTGNVPDGVDGPVALADGRVIIQDKTDVLQTWWSDTQGTNITPIMTAVDGLLQSLLQNGNTQFYTGVRI